MANKHIHSSHINVIIRVVQQFRGHQISFLFALSRCSRDLTSFIFYGHIQQFHDYTSVSLICIRVRYFGVSQKHSPMKRVKFLYAVLINEYTVKQLEVILKYSANKKKSNLKMWFFKIIIIKLNKFIMTIYMIEVGLTKDVENYL